MSESGLYDPDDPFAQALFAAGRDETPSVRALEKTLSTVGAAAVTLSVAPIAQASSAVLPKAVVVGTLAGKAAAPVAWVMFAKWTAIGLGAGLLTITVVDGVQHLAASNVDATSVVSTAARSPETPVETRSLAPLTSGADPARTRQDSPAPQLAEATPSAAPARSVGDALEAELAQVDKARAALGSGRWGEAFSESQRYEREHPRGRLLQEALLIRMRALEQMSDAADARAVARRLIRMSPSSPHAAQARALLEREGEIP